MKTFNELQEGVYDPNILKAFFLAGGPGSGKSYVVKRTTGGLGMKILNSDDHFERLLKQAGLDSKMPPEEKQPRDVARDRAKDLTTFQRRNFVRGRLGLIIDGTGKDFNKIAYQARELEGFGYDTHMIFVNTSLDVALQRNKERDRSIPEPEAVKMWNAVQRNIGKFSNFFKGNFIIIDNNNKDEDMMQQVFKRVRALATRKVKNQRGLQWIRGELEKKKRK